MAKWEYSAQADLNFRWANMSDGMFFDVADIWKMLLADTGSII